MILVVSKIARLLQYTGSHLRRSHFDEGRREAAVIHTATLLCSDVDSCALGVCLIQSQALVLFLRSNVVIRLICFFHTFVTPGLEPVEPGLSFGRLEI